MPTGPTEASESCTTGAPQAQTAHVKGLLAARYTEGSADTRAGWGYSGDELLAFHQELRGLVHENYNQAPSDREWELLSYIEYGKPADWGVEVIRRFNNYENRGEYEQVTFMIGQDIYDGVQAYRRSGNEAFLEETMLIADRLMTLHVKLTRDAGGDPFAGWNAKRSDGKEMLWLGAGTAFAGVAALSHTVLTDPSLAGKTAPQTDDQGNETYAQKAAAWFPLLKDVIEFREKHDVYRDGEWCSDTTCVEEDNKGGPASTNRFLAYTHLIMGAAMTAQDLDSGNYDQWAQQRHEVVDEVMAYFERSAHTLSTLRDARAKNVTWDSNQNAFISDYGPYMLWAYKPGRDNTEDYIHLMMDMEFLGGMLAFDSSVMPSETLSKVSVALMTCSFNYDTGRIPFNMDPKDGGKDPSSLPSYHRYYSPLYGTYVGKFLPDAAYSKFMERNLSVWDSQLSAGKLGRFSAYPAAREIVDARRARHCK